MAQAAMEVLNTNNHHDMHLDWTSRECLPNVFWFRCQMGTVCHRLACARDRLRYTGACIASPSSIFPPSISPCRP